MKEKHKLRVQLNNWDEDNLHYIIVYKTGRGSKRLNSDTLNNFCINREFYNEICLENNGTTGTLSLSNFKFKNREDAQKVIEILESVIILNKLTR